MAAQSVRASAGSDFDAILGQRRLGTAFQPIIELDSGSVVGYEALVRGPEGSPFASADALLSAAYRTNRVVEFDWAARAVACRAASKAGLGEGLLLFLNIEPLALDSECPVDLWPDIEAGFRRFPVVLEVTERSLMRDPAALLAGIVRYQHRVAGVALDDVGSNAMTLSMLSLLAPAVIKLDRQVIASAPAPAALRVFDAVYQESERTDAAILAEGIESQVQLTMARSLGATLGQGRYLGGPGPLPRNQPADARFSLRSRPWPPQDSPFAALEGRVTGLASLDVLVPLAEQVARRSADAADPAFFLALVPDPKMLEPAHLPRLVRMAQRGALAAVLGTGVPGTAATGVQVSSLDPADPAAREWALVALGPNSATAFLARAVPAGQGGGPEYEFGVTYEPRRVIAAARSLLSRLGR